MEKLSILRNCEDFISFIIRKNNIVSERGNSMNIKLNRLQNEYRKRRLG